MARHRRIIFIIVSGICLAIFHYFANIYSWYWLFTPSDLIVHWFAGMWAVFLMHYFATKTGLVEEHNPGLLMALFWGALLIGILWELFEVSSGVIRVTYEYPGDTFFDLLMDMVGAGMAVSYLRSKLKNLSALEKNKK